jgi:diguanylate cyclase (GGDEF)-like protein
MAEALLKHLVEITCHRDHALLDTSVLSALHELIGASHARVLEIFRFGEEMLVRPRVSIEGGKITSVDEILAPEHPGVAITNFPVLVKCIEQRKASAAESTADGNHILWMPVWTNDKVSACLEISSRTPYGSHTLNVIEGILSVYRNYQSLIDYSERDSLTGLLNRKTFDEKFSKMLSTPTAPSEEDLQEDPEERDDRRLHPRITEQWLAVVDIDHFKRVNDSFGHLYGDEVLILIANLLRSSFRSHDRIFRFGGEEFVILLRSTTLENALRIFERFRTNVAQYEFPQVGRVTVSLGFSSIKSHETPVVILGHADQALYYAKTNGRNQVCHYDELVKSGKLVLTTAMSHDTAEFFFDEPASSP